MAIERASNSNILYVETLLQVIEIWESYPEPTIDKSYSYDRLDRIDLDTRVKVFHSLDSEQASPRRDILLTSLLRSYETVAETLISEPNPENRDILSNALSRFPLQVHEAYLKKLTVLSEQTRGFIDIDNSS